MFEPGDCDAFNRAKELDSKWATWMDRNRLDWRNYYENHELQDLREAWISAYLEGHSDGSQKTEKS